MNSVPNKTIENKQQSLSIDSSLQELILEAEALFKVLDIVSAKITKLETSLSNIKAHFPFRVAIREGQESAAKKITDEVQESADSEWVATKVCWYLAWEPADENSKNYRLLLISEEIECFHYGFEDTYRPGGSRSKHIIYKKPLIETDLQTRLVNLEHLTYFVDRFTEHLKHYRISIIEGREIPYIDIF